MDTELHTLYTMAADAAELYPTLPAFEFLGKQTSYQQALQQIHQAAQGFYAMGIRSGDRVAMCLPNCPQAVLALYALNYLGAVCVMLHPLSAHGELTSALALTRAEVLLIRTSQALRSPSLNLTTVTVRLPGELPVPQKAGQLRWETVMKAGRRTRLPPRKGRGGDPAVILFSGGTTGTPKAVVHTNRSCNLAALQLLQTVQPKHKAGLRMLSLLPLFHGFGLMVGIHAPLLGGACCVLIPDFRTTSLGTLLLRKRPNLLPAVPAMLEALRADPTLSGGKLDFLQGIYCGGDALSSEQKQKLERFFAARGAAVPIRVGYGLTECVAAACLTPQDHPGTGSKPLPGMSVSICKPDTTEPLPTGLEGEICLTGPTVMVEYLQNPAATAQALRRHADGKLWLHTGDLGMVDGEGLLHFSQRLKRVIVTGGYNVYPCQLEAILQRCPGVEQVCVIGVPDPLRGQQVRAVIVPSCGGLTADDLQSYCRSRIARYALPQRYEFRTSLPLTPLGKVDRRALEQEYR